MGAIDSPWQTIDDVSEQYDVSLDSENWSDQLAQTLDCQEHDYFDPKEYTTMQDWARNAPISWFVNPPQFRPDDLSHRYGDAVEDKLSSYQDQTILDLGCCDTTGVPAIAGEDNVVLQVDNYRKGMEYADAFKHAYTSATQEEIRSTHIQADGEQLPFSRDTIDVIFAGAVFSRGDTVISDVESDLYRVLSDGGDILITSGYIQRSESCYEALELYNVSSLIDDRLFETADKKDGVLHLECYQPD